MKSILIPALLLAAQLSPPGAEDKAVPKIVHEVKVHCTLATEYPDGHQVATEADVTALDTNAEGATFKAGGEYQLPGRKGAKRGYESYGIRLTVGRPSVETDGFVLLNGALEITDLTEAEKDPMPDAGAARIQGVRYPFSGMFKPGTPSTFVFKRQDKTEHLTIEIAVQNIQTVPSVK
jgi:hypothetical protein